MFTHVDLAFGTFVFHKRRIHSPIILAPIEYEGTYIEGAEQYERQSFFASVIEEGDHRLGPLAYYH